MISPEGLSMEGLIWLPIKWPALSSGSDLSLLLNFLSHRKISVKYNSSVSHFEEINVAVSMPVSLDPNSLNSTPDTFSNIYHPIATI